MAIRRVEFVVEGDRVVGDLYVPEGEGPHPGLVFEGPLTSVKDQVTGNYAAAMARRGFVGLAIDHRHFGESEGAPRQYEHPGRKGEDIRAALTFLATQPEVSEDWLGVVGICAGAGYLAPLVAHTQIKAWGAVAGFFHSAAKQIEWMGQAEFDDAVAAARKARRHFEATGEAEHIPAVAAEGERAMPLQDAFEYYSERGNTANYTNAFALMSREFTLTWDAQSAAAQITVPTLIIHSDNALMPALARSFYEQLDGNKELLWTESASQTDFYDNPERIEPAAEALAEFFGQIP